MSPIDGWTPDAIPDLSGRTALVTGAASGIGLQTARVLAKRGARVLMAGRDAASLARAAATVSDEAAGVEPGTLQVDLADLSSIARLADTCPDERIDVLINNAGVMNVSERRETKDGYELTVGTNHLGHFALTAHLMPRLLRSAEPRVITVSAVAASWRRARTTDLLSETKYRPMTAYAVSKRANLLFTAELARRAQGTRLIAVAVHPGSAMTGLQRHTKGRIARLVLPLLDKAAMGSTEGAAWPSLYAATNSDVRSGTFYGPAGRRQDSGTPKLLPWPPTADDPTDGAALWSWSEQLTGARFAL